MQDLIVATVYVPEKEYPPPQEMVRLINHCENSKYDLIISTDANAHHTLWGSASTNFRGKSLLEYLSTTSLDVINTNSELTYGTRRSKTLIDFTLAT